MNNFDFEHRRGHPRSHQGQQVRTVMIEEEPWFVLTDVCKVLEMTRRPAAIKERLNEADVRSTYIRSGSQNRKAIAVNESGLYDVILDSRKPQAKQFRRWVTDVVLVAIDEHGGYLTPEKTEEVLLNPDTIIQGHFKTLDIPSGAIPQGCHEVQPPGLLGTDLSGYRSTLRSGEKLYTDSWMREYDFCHRYRRFVPFPEKGHLYTW